MSEGMHEDSESGGGMDHGGMHEDGDSYPPIWFDKAMLPEGMKVNPGDILEFKALETDKDGSIKAVYNTGKDGKSDDGMEEWENDFKQAMSAREPEEAA